MRLPVVKSTLLFLLFLLIFISSNINWGKERWKLIVKHDAVGYYAYLPAYFIYHDPQFGFIEQVEKEYHQVLVPPNGEFRQLVGSNHINKYFCGTALAQIPFFLAAHILSGWLGFAQDGYSKLYPISVNVAAIFYLFVGLIFSLRLLAPFNLREWQLSVLFLALVFGTNIFYYTIVEPGMSHVYSFAFITAFLYFSRRFFLSFKLNYVLIIGVVLGIITLIRPVNILVILLLPFAAGSFHNLKKGLNKLIANWLVLLLALLLFSVIISIQLFIYKITAGQYFIYSYGHETFHFLDPHFSDFLFSYKKGLFVYTPLFFVALAGGLFLWQKNRFQFLSLFGFLTVLLYVLSSWWCWWYGGSFSSRPMLEYAFLFMFLLAFAWQNIRSKILNWSYCTIIILLTLICQFQTYQYRKGYIHWEEMTKAKYWDVFLRPDKLLASSKNKNSE